MFCILFSSRFFDSSDKWQYLLQHIRGHSGELWRVSQKSNASRWQSGRHLWALTSSCWSRGARQPSESGPACRHRGHASQPHPIYEQILYALYSRCKVSNSFIWCADTPPWSPVCQRRMGVVIKFKQYWDTIMKACLVYNPRILLYLPSSSFSFHFCTRPCITLTCVSDIMGISVGQSTSVYTSCFSC